MISLTIDENGIAILTLDRPDGVSNVISDRVIDDLENMLEIVRTRPDIRGAVVMSGKPHFCLGLDLHELSACLDKGHAQQQLYGLIGRFGDALRRMELAGKPIVAAITGSARAAGMELALACHARVVADDPSVRLGFDGIAFGLMPGAGGTQRLVRLIGIKAGLPLLLDGKLMAPADAHGLGLIDEPVSRSAVVDMAKRKVLDLADALQPWDRTGFAVPGGAMPGDPSNGDLFNRAVTDIVRRTNGNSPAHIAIIDAIARGAPLPMDAGLRIERQNFTKLVSDPACRNSIRTLFVERRAAKARATFGAEAPLERIGVIGAGRMGRGIAHAAAMSGLTVTLTDINEEAARNSRDALLLQLAKRLDPPTVASIADRILLDPATLENCDLIIEAVFEDETLKKRILADIAQRAKPGALISSNTSYIPISELGTVLTRPADFIGIHFFSPVERMELVEIIAGRETSERTIARAVDFVRRLGKTPIVVNDGRGFYTSRCFSAFMNEGIRMLDEGIAPALIENAARMAGMPMGPLAIADEVTLDLAYKIQCAEQAAVGPAFVEDAGMTVPRLFVDALDRRGRPSGQGFYDYAEKGAKRLWPGLVDVFPRMANQPPVRDVEDRLLYVQALEAIHCLDGDIVTSRGDADLGSVLGWGFPASKGGAASFVDTVGAATFIARCDELANAYGERFRAPASLLARSALRIEAPSIEMAPVLCMA